jgi:hypothetical protein
MRVCLNAFLPALAVVFLCNCGSSASAGGGGGAPDSGIAGGTDGGGVANEKTAAFEAIKSKMASFDGSNRAQENRDMLAFVQGRSEFVESGLAEESGDVWARFADGRTLIIANNFAFPSPPANSVRPGPTALRSTKESGAPGTSKVVLAFSIGSYFRATSKVAAMFQKQNYDVQPDSIDLPDFTSQQISSVEGLKALDGVAVLYLFGHGALAPLQSGDQPEYAIWTSTVQDEETDSLYQADLDDGSLTYFAADNYELDEDQVGLSRLPEVRYAITAKFVEKYWTGKFVPHSLVFMNSCASSSIEALDFKLAVLNAGAGIYFGWNDPVQGLDAVESAAWFFDRVLGTNSFHAESPPQRPFEPLAVFAEMQTRPRPEETPGDADTLDSSTDPQTGLPSTLMPFTLTSDEGILAPSIESLAVNEATDELAVNGSLGSVQSKILMGNDELMIKSWDEVGAICELPRTGADAAGPVTVILANGHFSNFVPLTRWHGTAIYTVQEAGSLTMTMTFDFTFRGDIHGPREAPGEVVADHSVVLQTAAVSSGTYAFSGSFEDARADGSSSLEEWSGSGTLTAESCPNASQESCVQAIGTIAHGAWDIGALALAANGKHIHAVERNTRGVVISDTQSDQDAIGPDALFDGAGGFAGNLNGYDLAAGSRVFSVPSGVATGVNATLSLEWSAFPAGFAPDSTTQE